ncbi:heme lyase CcmF/NrfE family subunit [Kiloniella laminariae]|uniref:Heme lyase CcmF/NrfE family subunit n=1 Tax=Kiloniella laminariae TaxID=454162 RepID=A0ABT4LIL0_9PROT|nr:heme lyase CcmF/NrfE family subunit [Kiloniella laminariae]MCZ4280939.1 heme lyase CcmF/NrfE family subunit [Kiloniella laminariae]
MIAELGQFAIIMALLAAVVQATLPLIGAERLDSRLMNFGGQAALIQMFFATLAFGCLTQAYIVSDFTLLNVAENSHSSKPMLYKITGVWGNHEGSMLLWVLILAVFGAAVAAFGRNLPATLKARVLAIQAMIGVGFLTFLIFTSNPFTRLVTPPLNGNDLNPLLQDPGLAFHPPMLYIGYVGFSVAFSFAIAALIEGKVDAAWARWVRPWTLTAWTFLTGGIVLGSWWAYYELGWGGWWFWDPVENVSFMPWLMGTALLHSAIVVEKRNSLKVWTILLAILTFSLSLIGTFIVRSGLLTSVHAFAVNPERGIFILFLLAIAIGGSLTLFALRAPALKAGGIFSPISREGGLLLNNLLLSTACATVFLGTLYPLFLEAIGGGRVSIGPPFYNNTFVPVMIPLLLLVCVGAHLPWKRADLLGVLGRLKFAGLATIIAALVAWYIADGGPLLAILGLGMASWLLLGTISEWMDRIKLFRAPLSTSWQRAINLPGSVWGMTLAHGGLAIAVAGMIATTAWKVEEVAILKPGETLSVFGTDYRFEGVREITGPNYGAIEGTFVVSQNGEYMATLKPEKRLYNVQKMPTTEAAIHSTFVGDYYAVIGDPDGTGGWTVRIYREPLVTWIWFGCGLMVFAGLVSLADRRLRVGAPADKKQARLPRKAAEASS